MKNFVINNLMKTVKKSCSYNETQLEEVEYGLVSLYLLISKLFIISILTLLLGIFKEMIILMLFYNFIRMPSFGIHASKSWICLLSSSLIFVGVPLICKIIAIPIYLKSIIGIIGVLLMYKNSPADTHKRPIVNVKRRQIYKLLSVFIAFIYSLLSIIMNNNFICNSLLFSIIIQLVVISPLTYKLFNMPYNNYKNYSLNLV